MTNLQATVLRLIGDLCTADSGFCTDGIAGRMGRQPGFETNRQHSQLVSRTLRELEAAGRVRRLDDKKPIVWCKAN